MRIFIVALPGKRGFTELNLKYVKWIYQAESKCNIQDDCFSSWKSKAFANKQVNAVAGNAFHLIIKALKQVSKTC